mgnify:CR=1 FL=1
MLKVTRGLIVGHVANEQVIKEQWRDTSPSYIIYKLLEGHIYSREWYTLENKDLMQCTNFAI